MLNLVMLILSNKQKSQISTSISTFDIHNPTVLLIFTILLKLHLPHCYYYCFLVQWTTQMVTILESRCPIFISMKPKITTLNSYNNKIRQTQKQLNKYNSTTTIIIILLLLQPIRALSRSDYYYHFALTKPSCSISMLLIFGLIKTAHSLQRQSTDDNNDENENCTNPTQKTKKKKTNPFSIFGLLLISATKISMMIKMMKAKKYLMKNFFFRIFFQNPQFNLFSSFRLSFSQKSTQIIISYARYMYKKIKQMFKTINLILLFF
jgi:hypothetical protein